MLVDLVRVLAALRYRPTPLPIPTRALALNVTALIFRRRAIPITAPGRRTIACGPLPAGA
jgi:hypothetical protein